MLCGEVWHQRKCWGGAEQARKCVGYNANGSGSRLMTLSMTFSAAELTSAISVGTNPARRVGCEAPEWSQGVPWFLTYFVEHSLESEGMFTFFNIGLLSGRRHLCPNIASGNVKGFMTL